MNTLYTTILLLALAASASDMSAFEGRKQKIAELVGNLKPTLPKKIGTTWQIFGEKWLRVFDLDIPAGECRRITATTLKGAAVMTTITQDKETNLKEIRLKRAQRMERSQALVQKHFGKADLPPPESDVARAKKAFEDAQLRSMALWDILTEMEVVKLVHDWDHPFQRGTKAVVKDADFLVQPCDRGRH